jgi:hypothetical protein
VDSLLGDQWIGSREAAELTGYTVGMISHLCKNERIKCQKVVTVWLIDRQSLLDYAAWAKEQGKHDGRFGPGD